MAHALLVFIPLSLALRYLFDAPAGWVFLTGAAAITVLADWLRRATDQLAERAGSTIGGLLNISFGNTAELILALFVLSRAHVRTPECVFPLPSAKGHEHLQVPAGVDRNDRPGGVRQVGDRGHHGQRHVTRLDRTLERCRQRCLSHHLLGAAGDEAGVDHARRNNDDADLRTEHARQRHAHRV
jgi:hypothetical protein